MLLVFLTSEYTSIKGFVQTTKRVRTDFANKTADAVMEQEPQHLFQFLFVNNLVFKIIEYTEQEEEYSGLLQLLQVLQQSINFFAVFVVAVQEGMVEISIVQNFFQHCFVGVLAIVINGLKYFIGIALLGETINLDIEVVQEESGHICPSDEQFCLQPIFFVKVLLVGISHQHKVSDFICQTQRHTSRVNSFEHLLCIIFIFK